MRDPEDVAAFRKLIADIYAFYRADITDSVLSIWWNAMLPYDLAAIRAAAGRHVADPDGSKFVPKPGEIIRYIQGGSVDAALVAWYMVDAAIKSVGTYESVVFDDAITQRVVHDMGGWVWFGQQNEQQWPFVRNQFCTLYRSYTLRGRFPYPPRLSGLIELENVRTGYPLPNPVFIGDLARAQAVLANGAKTGMLPVHVGTLALVAPKALQ